MPKMMTVRPPEKLHNTLRSAAKEQGYTLNQLILQILWDWVKKQEKEITK